MRHWKALFAGLSQTYDHGFQYLVNDLVCLGLRDHETLILAICDGAAAEHALESYLKHLIRRWEETDIKLAKHIPVDRPSAKTRKATELKGTRNMRTIIGPEVCINFLISVSKSLTVVLK